MSKSNMRNAILAVAHGLAELCDRGETSEMQAYSDANAVGEAWLELCKDTPEGAAEGAERMAECPDLRVQRAARGEFSYSIKKLGAPYVAMSIMVAKSLQDGIPQASLAPIGMAIMGLHSKGILRKVSLDLLIAFGEGKIPGLDGPMAEYPDGLLNDLKLLIGEGEIPDYLPEEL